MDHHQIVASGQGKAGLPVCIYRLHGGHPVATNRAAVDDAEFTPRDERRIVCFTLQRDCFAPPIGTRRTDSFDAQSGLGGQPVKGHLHIGIFQHQIDLAHSVFYGRVTVDGFAIQ